MVIATGREFFRGANLMLILMNRARQENGRLHLMVRQFRNVTLAIKHARSLSSLRRRPRAGRRVRIALHGRASTPQRKPTWDSSKSGVGLIPGGGGTKEMMIRANERRRRRRKPPTCTTR